MIRLRSVLAGALLLYTALVTEVAAQPLGTFRWQLQPFCNVVAVAITQNGAVYRLEGTDDQCGNGADAASVTGTAFPNADGTIGFGLNIVTSPGGRPLHVDAEITTATFSGTWRDSAGATGTFVLTPAAGNGGSPRPLPSAVPSTIVLRPDGGFVAGGVQGLGAIPASGPGSRMMWHPGKVAFRAGRAVGSRWDDASVGLASVAFGEGTTASGIRSTAMGFNTTASHNDSTAMGQATTASGFMSTAMGFATTASGQASTAMGSGTIASDETSTAIGIDTDSSGIASLAGGIQSVASGNAALAFGNGARAIGINSVALGTRPSAGNGSFVFADSSSLVTLPTSPNQFAVRAVGGAFFFSNAAMTLGVQLSPSGTDWTSLSDVHAKHRFRELDGDDVLAKIARMPVTEWSYKEQDGAIRHIGPTAQDFHAAFGLGGDPLRIGTMDADGVALAAVRALEARSRAQAARIDALERALAEALAALCGVNGACR